MSFFISNGQKSVFNFFCRYSAPDFAWGDIFGYHSTRRDYSTFTYFYSRNNSRIMPYPYVIFNYCTFLNLPFPVLNKLLRNIKCVVNSSYNAHPFSQ